LTIAFDLGLNRMFQENQGQQSTTLRRIGVRTSCDPAFENGVIPEHRTVTLSPIRSISKPTLMDVSNKATHIPKRQTDSIANNNPAFGVGEIQKLRR